MRVLDPFGVYPLWHFHPLGRPVGPFGTARKVIKGVVTPWSQEIDGG